MAEGEIVAGEKKTDDLIMLRTMGSDVKYTSRCDAKCVVGIRVKGVISGVVTRSVSQTIEWKGVMRQAQVLG